MTRWRLFPVLALTLAIVAAYASAEGERSRVDLTSPRATMRTFLDALPKDGEHDAEAAVACLDFGKMGDQSDAEKIGLAYELKEIIDRTRRVSIASITPGRVGNPFVFAKYAGGEIVISQAEPPDGPWLFSAETVAAISSILPEARKRERVAGREEVPFSASPALWLRSKMPAALQETAFLLEHWQWLALLALSILGILVERIVNVVVPAYFRRVLRKKRLDADKRTLKSGLRPFGLLAMALTWLVFLDWVGLPPSVGEFLEDAVGFLASVAGVVAAYRIVDVVSDVLDRRARRTSTQIDDLLVPLVRKSAKVFVTVAGLVFIASVLELKITSLLAGLGLGGIAFALAAKETVANLFGSVTIILDRPFHIGDWVKIGDHEGSVEEVGFRSTRIRTFYNSQITVPNSIMISAVVDNMGARRYRRIKTTIGVQYDTSPEKIEAFCEGIRELVRRHPYTRKDYYHVYLNAFGPSSLDILLYIFHETPEWATELRERHRLYVDIVRLAKRLGVEFAFPTQTIHMAPAAEEAAPDGEVEAPRSAEVDDALKAGRREARRIVDGTLGDRQTPPPPVNFHLPESEMRGDSGEGEGS